MNIKLIKTEKILKNQIKLEGFLDKYILKLPEKSIIVITSKIIAVMENRIKPETENLRELIRQEADFIANEPNQYGNYIAMKYNAFIGKAGIDQSNGNGDYILLPKDPQKSARKIYKYLSQKFKTKDFGVIITDSRSMPLRRGVFGVAIGFYGFALLNSYIGKEDLFGRKLKIEKANVVDSLAIGAVLAMGEGCEQTPLALITDIDFVCFNQNYPTKTELKEFYVSLDEDIFHQFYTNFK